VTFENLSTHSVDHAEVREVKSSVVLVADDDTDDCELLSFAFSEIIGPESCDLRFVEDGHELLQYLRREDRYSGAGSAPRPALILLDFNMPKMDGREALVQIKADANLRRTPVVVLSTSAADEDIDFAYDNGAAGYITKPASVDDLVAMVSHLCGYWHDTVTLPRGE